MENQPKPADVRPQFTAEELREIKDALQDHLSGLGDELRDETSAGRSRILEQRMRAAQSAQRKLMAG